MLILTGKRGFKSRRHISLGIKRLSEEIRNQHISSFSIITTHTVVSILVVTGIIDVSNYSISINLIFFHRARSNQSVDILLSCHLHCNRHHFTIGHSKLHRIHIVFFHTDKHSVLGIVCPTKLHFQVNDRAQSESLSKRCINIEYRLPIEIFLQKANKRSIVSGQRAIEYYCIIGHQFFLGGKSGIHVNGIERKVFKSLHCIVKRKFLGCCFTSIEIAGSIRLARVITHLDIIEVTTIVVTQCDIKSSILVRCIGQISRHIP